MYSSFLLNLKKILQGLFHVNNKLIFLRYTFHHQFILYSIMNGKSVYQKKEFPNKYHMKYLKSIPFRNKNHM